MSFDIFALHVQFQIQSAQTLIRFHRPKEFVKAPAYPEDSDDEESTVGKMPPSDSEDE